MYIEDLHRRLIEVARQKVHAGEVTERGLARKCDISQPHLHNVLKNIRDLSASSADRLMHALNLTVPELIWRYPGDIETGVRAIPLLRHRIGPGYNAVLTSFGGFTPLPLSLVEGLVDPVVARLSPDLVMPEPAAANDLVLLDQNPAIRANPRGRSCWVVAETSGMRVRYVKLGGTRIYLANESTVHDPQRWDAVALHGRNILDIVKARIVWIGREMETEHAGPAESPGSLLRLPSRD